MNIFFVLQILLLTWLFSEGQAASLLPTTPQSPIILALESVNILKIPERFRSTQDLSKLNPSSVSIQGLESLKISGSAQFSELELKALLNHLPKKIYIVDLRRESHGFVNNIPVMWASYHNWENRHLSQSEIIKKEKDRLENLQQQYDFKGISCYPKKSSFFEPAKEVFFPIQTVSSEREMVGKTHALYQRFYASDHMFPSEEIIEEFLRFIHSLPHDTWLHFHCRAGRGRTTTFMVLYDIIKNGREVPLKEIVKRHALLGGVDLQAINTKAVHPWALKEAHERIKKVKNFYLYINDPKGYKVQNWQNWLKSREKLT